jgi:hypothetical protein
VQQVLTQMGIPPETAAVYIEMYYLGKEDSHVLE